jgi:predicted nucleic acid-binding Zn ribbon protein
VSRRSPRPLSSVLDGFTAALSPASTLARVNEVWAGAVGEAIAAEASPASERDGILTITCSAAVWAQELDLMAEQLIAALNQALGTEGIRELRCRTA